MADDPLQHHRTAIDHLDQQIIHLLNQRAREVIAIGKIKQEQALPIYAPHREKAVLEKVRKLNAGPLPDRCLEAVYRELMSGSFALEKPLRIGYLGPEGTFSHQAAKRKFGSSVEYVPLTDISAVFDEVIRGHTDYGMVPVENSLHGGVVDTLDSFATYCGGGQARICAEVLVTIHHNVLAREPWEQIRIVCSKPEVFTQCRRWLSQTAKGLDIRPVASTSKAAELAAHESGVAAIGSRLAGEIHGLKMLFENIEDQPDNVTRFFVIGTESAKPSGEDKTAILFTTDHRPGALAAVLDVFRDAGVNLTDIEKRPSKQVNWEYFFFIDAVGHADEEKVQAAVNAARPHCRQLHVLGSYPRAAEIL